MKTTTLTDEITINAPKNKIWRVIEDASLLPQWHPFVRSVTGKHEVGQVRVCELDMGGQRATAEERCNTKSEQGKIIWTLEKDSMGTAQMFAMEYGFEIEDQGNGQTLVRSITSFTPQNEEAAGMAEQTEAQFHKIHQAVLDGLKRYVESK